MKIELNSKGIQHFLTSDKVRQMCEDFAKRGLASAGEGAFVDSEIDDPRRARAALVGRASEMGGALDAMRH